jgi:hypothetical protein
MKVRNAMICLSCDEVFNGGECPCCLSKSSYPLRRWVKPLEQIGGKHYSNNALSLESKAKPVDGGDPVHGSCRYPVPANERGHAASAGEPIRLIQNNRKESSELKPGQIYNSSGEPMELKSGLPKRSHWIDAGYAYISRIITGRAFLPGTEHNRWVQTFEILSADKP